MTQNSVDAVLLKAANDAKFRGQLAADPDKALALFGDQLSAEELAELKSLSPAVLNSLSRINHTAAAERWYVPGSFKEFGGALLSVILLVLLLFVFWQTLSAINNPPQTVQFGESLLTVDSFARSKDLLNLFFPLFSAVVTFWLGVSVESRRADKNEAEADQARQDEQEARQGQMEAQADLAGTIATAKATLAQVKAAVRHAQSVTQVVSGGGAESALGSLGATGAGAAPAGDPFASAFAAIESAEQQLQ